MLDEATLSGYREMVRYGVPNLRGRYAQCDLGTISAYQKDKSEEENEKATKHLMDILIGLGYSVTPLYCDYYNDYKLKEKGGRYGVKMLLVMDRESNYQLKENLVKLGEVFKQDFVTFYRLEPKAYTMIGTNPDYEIVPFHTEKKLGTAFFTSIGFIQTTNTRRPFIYESIAVERPEDYYQYDYNLSIFSPEKQAEMREYSQNFMSL